MGQRSRGSAIVLVLIFITVMSVVSVGSSYLASGRRRVEALSTTDFKAFELASSAIDFAASEVLITQVFPGSPYRDPVRFMNLVAQDDMTKLRQVCSGCSEWRTLKDAEGKDAGQIWVAWTFPAKEREKVDVTPVLRIAKKDPSVQSLEPVVMKPLRFRRDLVVGRWQNWGVLRFETTAVVQDAVARTTLTLTADRMFSLEVTTDPADGRITEARLVVSAHNLRTSVRKS